MAGKINDEWSLYEFKGDKVIANLLTKMLHGRYRFSYTWIDTLVQCLCSNRSMEAISRDLALNDFLVGKPTNNKAWADVFEVLPSTTCMLNW
jgi:hypothetical protein